MTDAVRKIAPAALIAAALAVAPAFAAGHGHGPNAHARGHGPNAHANAHGRHGNSHKCRAHKVGWVVRGTVVDGTTLADGAQEGRFDGTVVVDVTGTNHHARDQQDAQHSYDVTGIRASFGVADANGDGTVDAADVQPGDQVKLIGKVEKVAKRCDTTPSSEPTIRKAAFNSPESETPETETQQTETQG